MGKKRGSIFLAVAMLLSLFPQMTLPAAAAEREALKFTQISAGSHTLALRDDGTVFAWGNNQYGLIGDGTVGDSTVATSKLSPIKIDGFGGKKIKAVYAGSNSSYALAEDGTVWSWGNGEYTGLGVSTNVLVPTQITGLSGKNIVEINGCMALDDTGAVWTWGSNYVAMLGIGSDTPNKSLTPVKATVLSGKHIKAIRGGETTTRAAIASDGTVWAWGSNSSKVLTNTTNTFEANPIQITLPGGRAIKDIEIGNSASIYILATDGTVWSKGNNSYGQLGIGNTTAQTSFVQISSLSGVTDITAGSADTSPFAMALKSDGTFYSWGVDYPGKLGTGTYTSATSPIKGLNPSGLLIKSLDCGTYHSTFLTTEGRVFSAGEDTAMGNNTGAGSGTPTEIFVPATSIKIDQQNVELSDTYQLTATVEPAYASGVISWGSNPFSVAAIDVSTGLLTAKKKGTAEAYVLITTNPAGDKKIIGKTNVTVKARAGLAKYGGEDGKELFLHGEFLELGISKWGDFGTLGQKPAGFRGTNGSTRIGMSADHDGFNNGLDMPVDYYLPGCPEERFVMGYKDAEQKAHTNTNSAVMGDKNMETTVTNLSKTADGLLKAKVVSTWDGVMEITQIIQFQDNEQFFRNEVTIKNLSANPLDSVRYMRTFDPDNTVFMGGSYVTKNTILDNSANGTDGKAVVVAETADENDPLRKSSLNTTAPIFFYSKDPRAKVSAFGFTNKDPYYELAYGNARPKDYTITTDGAISMAMDTGTIAAGASSGTFVYYTSLDKRVFSEVIKDIQGDEGGTPVTPPNENPPSYQVTFQAENGTEITKATVLKGYSATKPEPPSLSGKAFSDWQVTVGSPSTLDAVNNDMTVKAVYKAATTYVVTFISDGGSLVDPLNVTANSLITEPAVPTKAGYTFKGWKKDANNYWAFASNKISGDITLTADWAANPSVFYKSAETIPDVTVGIGTPKEAALAKLPTSVKITDSKGNEYPVTVTWAFNTVGGVYDPYQPGRYVGIGDFTLPDGVAWENDQPIKLQGIVYIADLAKRVSSIAIKDKTTTTIAYPYDLEHPLTLAAEVSPADTDIKTYRWSSSDPSVATIDQTGKITPVRGGTTTITVTSDDGGKTDSLTITVAKSNECDVLVWKTPASPTIAADNAQKISKTVENATNKLKVDVTVSPKASWKLYSDSACTNEISNQDWALSYGDNTGYLKVTAEDGVATKTYALTVTRPKLIVDATDLTSLIYAPIKLELPVTTAINATQYSSGIIVWKTKEGDAQTTPFEGKKEYVASATLSPKEAYTFDGFTANFSYIGATKVETSGSGDSRTVTITFPATDEKIRPHIAVAPTVASNELTYGEALSKLTWNNTPSAQKSMTSSVAVDGVFAWADSSIKPDVPATGTYAAEWVFTPTDTDNYVATKGTVAITVHPKELTIKDITIADKFYDGLLMATIAGTAALDGVLTVDASNVTLNKTNATASFSDANVGGDKAVTVSGYALSGSRAGNYVLKQPEGLKASIKEDKTAPNLTADAVSRVSHTNASISFRADERGTYYYAIVASGETAPTVDTTGAGMQMQGGLNSISLTNLTSGAKQIYIKGKNATGLISTLLVMDIPNYSTGGGGGSTNNLPPVVTPNVKIPVIIDGASYNLGQAITETNLQNKVKTTVVTVEEKAFNEQLAKAKESVIIPIPQMEGATANRSVLTAEMVDRAAEKKMVIDVQSKGIDYIIPATAVDVSTVASSLGVPKGDFDDIQMDITITNLTEDAARFVSDAAQKGDYKLMLPPVEFKVAASHGGRTVEVSSFNNYVERVIAIPSGIDPHRITTGVVVRPDGTEYHVPTEVFKAKDGGYYARVHSRTNSVYALIWNEESFLDSVGTWYESVVAEMASRKIIKGRDEHSFDGNGNITRAEFAAIIVRGLGLPENGKSQFKDVPANSWYYGAVGKAFEFGIIQGRSAEIFDPEANISREEVMAMLQHASVIAEFKGQEGNREVLRKQFQDYGTISAWAEKDVLFNVANGLMKGYDGKLRPNDSISRAECATAVLRLLQKAELVDIRSKT